MQTDEFIDVLSGVLWRCAVMGFLLVLVWFGVMHLAESWIYQQGAWFGLSAHECDIIHYCGLALVKIVTLVFFLFPYIAIRLVLGKRRKKSS